MICLSPTVTLNLLTNGRLVGYLCKIDIGNINDPET
jgi:hypothetical protein